MIVTTAPGLTLADLERALSRVEPAALLVPPRILRRVIKADRDFDGPGLTVLCPLVVHGPEGMASSGQPGFRDALCGVIGDTVRSVAVGTDTMVVTFDRHKLELPFGKSGSPEQLTFHDRDGRTYTFAKD